MADRDIAIDVAPEYADSVSERELAQLAATVLEAEAVEPPAALSVVITDDETVRELNRRFRSRDEATDVLSFGLDDGDGFATPPGSPRQLGEVVISFPAAQRQAQDAGHTLQQELSHLLAHGILHILGYDHEEPDEASRMQEREEAVLHGWRH